MKSQHVLAFALLSSSLILGCSEDSKPANYDYGSTKKDTGGAGMEQGVGQEAGGQKEASVSKDSAGGAKDHLITIDKPAGTNCPTPFAGCTNYIDWTSSTSTTINFGGAGGNTYQPNCVKIKSGQSITFAGDFTMHPLAQACGPASVITNGTGSSTTFKFSGAGTWGYYCTLHGTASGSGMAGSIQVVP
jgi:plastocyanin